MCQKCVYCRKYYSKKSLCQKNCRYHYYTIFFSSVKPQFFPLLGYYGNKWQIFVEIAQVHIFSYHKSIRLYRNFLKFSSIYTKKRWIKFEKINLLEEGVTYRNAPRSLDFMRLPSACLHSLE